MQLDIFLKKLQQTPEQISFAETMATIDANYHFTPTAFQNAGLENAAGQNSGSCKLLFFARLHRLSTPQTLACFGDYYRIDVLENPLAADHQNIRRFMQSGMAAVEFAGTVLTPR